MDKTLNTFEKKEALLEEDEKKNKKNINSTSGLSDLKTHMVASRISSMENSRKKKMEIEYDNNDNKSEQQNSRTITQSYSSVIGDFPENNISIDYDKMVDEYFAKPASFSLSQQKQIEGLNSLKLPNIEDIITKDEPEFDGLTDIFGNLKLEKIKYFAKWMDMIFLEESFEKEK